MDVPTRRDFNLSLHHPKQPVMIKDIDQFLENQYVIMSPGWNGVNGGSKSEDSTTRRKVQKEVALLANTGGEKKKWTKCSLGMGNHSAVQCPKLIESGDKERLLRQHYLCIYCTSHKYKRREARNKRKNLKCEICKKTAFNSPASMQG
ncbi:unnamed protein product [Hermetia illucens]|uniref:Uncharacterized protein n=1 Tax=Hermetia illucens TaxID=343691 RepID=A0A7R8V4W6_HERIL|nr:unnamed protein product [Hermetia illucens]